MAPGEYRLELIKRGFTEAALPVHVPGALAEGAAAQPAAGAGTTAAPSSGG